MVPPGSLVKRGQPIIKVVNSAWARLRVVVPAEHALRFDRSVPVNINFPAVPGLRFGGWVTAKHAIPGDNRVVVEMQVTRPDEPYGTQSVLLAMAYGSPPAKNADELELVPRAVHVSGPSERLFSLVPTMLAAAKAQENAAADTGPLTGRLALVPQVPRFGPAACPDPRLRENLEQLHEWQNSFVDGMTTAIYNQKLLLSYPKEGEISQAVEKMMKGEVEHDPGYCAPHPPPGTGLGAGRRLQLGRATPAARLPRPGGRLASTRRHLGLALHLRPQPQSTHRSSRSSERAHDAVVEPGGDSRYL